MNRLILGLAAAASMAAALPAFTAAANAQPVDHREVRQQQRIVQGARSGELRPGEVRRLEVREDRLHRHEAVMRARDGGALTHRARRVLVRQENRDSRAIYRLKHNGHVD